MSESIFFFRLFDNTLYFVIWSFWVIFSICFHEMSHAYVAYKFGDNTAADAGHLTMNPLRQMGIQSLISFLLLGIAWGQVPVNPQRLTPRYKAVLVSLAGPFSNLAIFFFCCIAPNLIIAAMFYAKTPEIYYKMVGQFFLYGGCVNMILFIINMLPLPGLDGWHLVAPLFDTVKILKSELVTAVGFGLFLLIFFYFEYIYAAAVICVQYGTLFFARLLENILMLFQ
ncbi:MAG: site-2 protease family protein [Lentisphaeria bacterium]|nr:site-2 protease family protein [Lentisphaeria bacterium]